MTDEVRYHEREHARYLAEHRHDIVSMAEEISCAKALDREAHAFTCQKCGCHVTRWHAGKFYCQQCGQLHPEKPSKATIAPPLAQPAEQGSQDEPPQCQQQEESEQESPPR